MATKIIVNNNGSFRVEGEDIELLDANGNRYGLNGRVKISLCRCGQSKTKPFCDASHKTNGFQSVCEAYEMPPVIPKAADWWRVPRGTLGPVLRIGLPGAAENIAWRVAFLVSVAAVGQMGAAPLATQAYALQVSYVVLLFGLATGLSVEIVVGHLIGAGRLHHANRLLRRALAVGLGVSLLAALFAALIGPWIFSRFTRDASIIAAGSALLWWTVLLEPGRTFNLVVINALRATGDARYPVMVGAGSMAIVLAGGSWLLGVGLGWGLTGVWIAYAADEWLRGLLMWRRWATQGWVPHARASHRRLRRERVPQAVEA